MGWFQSKDKKRKPGALKTLKKTLEEPAVSSTSSVSILDGDENASTPVEKPGLGRLARIQPFNAVAISLLRLFDREEVSLKQVVRLVQSDPALAAETLAFVNSPLFSIRGNITDLQHAIAVLGANNVKSLVTTLAMRSMLKSAPKPLVVRRLWRHSIATATIATELAPIYGVAPDLANTAGVLHDVGRMGLLAEYRDDYAHMVLSLYDNVDAILVAERELCALDHCDVGMVLGKAWKLPKVFQEVASTHHKAKGETGILGLIHTACAMADDITFAAISHRGIMPIADRVTECVPESLRKQVMTTWEGAEQRIVEKVNVLDF